MVDEGAEPPTMAERSRVAVYVHRADTVIRHLLPDTTPRFSADQLDALEEN
jgi:hypothetical protein